MTDKELKKLSRAELLEILVEQSQEIDRLQLQLSQVQKKLKSRRIAISEAGSIAEAALKLNGVFEAAQKAADQYLENIRNDSRKKQDENEEECENGDTSEKE